MLQKVDARLRVLYELVVVLNHGKLAAREAREELEVLNRDVVDAHHAEIGFKFETERRDLLALDRSKLEEIDAI